MYDVALVAAGAGAHAVVGSALLVGEDAAALWGDVALVALLAAIWTGGFAVGVAVCGGGDEDAALPVGEGVTGVAA